MSVDVIELSSLFHLDTIKYIMIRFAMQRHIMMHWPAFRQNTRDSLQARWSAGGFPNRMSVLFTQTPLKHLCF